MHFWHSAPFVRITIPFITGIFCCLYLPFTTALCAWLCFISASLCLFMLLFNRRTQKYHLRWLPGIPFQVLLFSTGVVLTAFNNERDESSHFSHAAHSPYALIRVDDNPVARNRSHRTYATVLSLVNEDTIIPCSGKILLYLEGFGSSSRQPVKYGDILLVKAAFEEVSPPRNPGEFDYKQFLAYRNIFHQLFLKNGQWTGAGHKPQYQVVAFALETQQHLLSVFREHVPGRTESGMAEALIFGYKYDLDPELVAAYSDTGTLHVLAVSGLHVGIIFIVLAALLKFMERSRKLRITRALIILVFLWVYALVTGFSPSVIRAVTMFSLVIAGKMFDRQANIYNSICASAFIILAANPYFLFDVGFQLSYLAVLGIVYLQPLIIARWEAPNWLMHQVWSLTAVSIAAQVGTLPISLFYFHQFPVYFILSNLLIIPLTNIIVYTGLLLLALSFSPLLAGWTGELMAWLIWLTNHTVNLLRGLPFALADNIFFNSWQMLFLFLLIMCLLAWLALKNKIFFLSGLAAAVGMVAADSWSLLQARNSRQLAVYNVPGNRVIRLTGGTQSLLISGGEFSKDIAAQKRFLNALLRDGRIQQTDLDTSRPRISFYAFAGRTIAIAGPGSFSKNELAEKIPTDILVLTGNPGTSIKSLARFFRPGKIISDASNSPYKNKRWRKECLELNIPFVDVSSEGAFVTAF